MAVLSKDGAATFNLTGEIKKKNFEKVLSESRAFLERFFFREKSPKKDVTLKQNGEKSGHRNNLF